MTYSVFADFVVVFHFLFVLFVIFGGFALRRHPKLVYAHVPAAIWGALIEFAGWICPLTPLENSLRLKGGGAGYEGGFVEHYIIPVLYPHGLNRSIQGVLGALVIAVNAVAYYRFYHRSR